MLPSAAAGPGCCAAAAGAPAGPSKQSIKILLSAGFADACAAFILCFLANVGLPHDSLTCCEAAPKGGSTFRSLTTLLLRAHGDSRACGRSRLLRGRRGRLGRRFLIVRERLDPGRHHRNHGARPHVLPTPQVSGLPHRMCTSFQLCLSSAWSASSRLGSRLPVNSSNREHHCWLSRGACQRHKQHLKQGPIRQVGAPHTHHAA
jgi:hypothetical protein